MEPIKMKIKVRAHSNIALIKYWGKNNILLNTPAVGSISLTLDGLFTETAVEFDEKLKADSFILNDNAVSENDTKRISMFLEKVRKMSGVKNYAKVVTSNNFPTAAGLASSASGFAALAMAASEAAGLQLSPKALSILARKGSGSAARSILGGFVEMYKGEKEDGTDSFAEQIKEKDYWDIRLLAAVTTSQKKKVASTDGMRRSKQTSPYYAAWLERQEIDLDNMRRSILDKNFTQLGELAEYSALKMHAMAMASHPGLIYWNGATIEGIQLVYRLREQGVEVYFTIDAGPQLKIICLPENENKVIAELQRMNGIQQIIRSKPGPGAMMVQ
jgi:diphosphomevalonate decarboxylase